MVMVVGSRSSPGPAAGSNTGTEEPRDRADELREGLFVCDDLVLKPADKFVRSRLENTSRYLTDWSECSFLLPMNSVVVPWLVWDEGDGSGMQSEFVQLCSDS